MRPIQFEQGGKGAGIEWLRANIGYSGENCLTWPMYRDPKRGYGLVGINRRVRYAHRIMCELVHGAPPTPAHEAAHSCGRGHHGCVNPRHLSWKTRIENQHDRRKHHTQGDLSVKKYKLAPEDVEEIRGLFGKMTTTDIAAKYGVTRSTIRQIETGKIWGPDKRRKRLLAPDEVAAIKAQRGTRPARQIAADYGVDHNVIWRIHRGMSYSAMPPPRRTDA